VGVLLRFNFCEKDDHGDEGEHDKEQAGEQTFGRLAAVDLDVVFPGNMRKRVSKFFSALHSL